MKAMLLCAGLGTRLRPLTDACPKPLLPLFGRPVVEYLIESLAEAGVGEIIINLHHLPELFRERIGNRCCGVAITYSHEPEILGPVGGIRKALPMLGDGNLLIVNGDVVMDFDFNGMVKFHEENGAALTLAAGAVTERPELHAIGADAGGRVRQLWRKPDWGGDALREYINLGSFVYNSSIVERYIPENSFYDFREQLMPELFRNDERVMAYPVECYWNDIGSPASYLQAHLDVFVGVGPDRIKRRLAGGFKAGVDCGWNEPVYIGGNAEIAGGATVGPNVSLESGCRVGKDARISNSVVLPGASVPDGAVVDRSIAASGGIIKC
jgi:mannose-1-phosphate guanylyltransferase